MKQTLKNIGIFLLVQMYCCVLMAQHFVNVSLDGAQTVCSIHQDKNGILWLGTDNGLFSYDGYHSYRHYAEGSEFNTRVNALGQKDNLLYLATGSGLQTFDMDTYTYCKLQDKKSKDAVEGSSKAHAELRVLDMQGSSNYGSDVYALLHTRRGLLTGTISGLYLGKSQIKICSGRQPLVNALAYDAHRRCYWIGTEGALYRANLELTSFTRIPAFNNNSIKCFAQAANGTLYIGTDNGLFSMNTNGGIVHYLHDSHDASTISNNIVWTCYVDQWQNVWAGTDNGLSCLMAYTYYIYTPLYKVTPSHEGNCLHAICQTHDGEWWMGGTNGLIRQGLAWYKQNNSQYGLSHNRVRKIYEDHDGYVWICTDHGINLFDRQSRQMINFIVYDQTHRYSTAWAYDILEDRMGRMWMASYMGGVFVIDKRRLMQTLTNRRGSAGDATINVQADRHFSDGGTNRLSGLHVGQLVIDGQGMIWASSYNRIDKINPRTMQVSAVENSAIVNYLMADAKGNIWVGGNGVVKCFVVALSTKNQQVKSKEWKIGGKAVCMCDVEGKTWVVSGRECCVIAIDGQSFRFKIPSDVIPLAMFYSPVQRTVVMGGNDGFVSVSADAPLKNKKSHRLLLSGVEVNGRQLQTGSAEEQVGRKLTEAPCNMEKLVIKSSENNFVLQLTDLPFSGHPSSVYVYRLEGNSPDWQYMNRDNLDIAYNGLPHGSYHLTVHVLDGEGNVGDEVYSLDISILPPWYLTIWAKLFYLFVVAGLVWGIVKFFWVRRRLAEEQRQKAEILSQVDMRMNFFNRLAEDLKTAVNHRSFDEILYLANNCLGIKTEKTEIEKPALAEVDRRLLKEITEVIEAHMIDSDFNVTTLQEMVGIGGKQLYRKVKAMTGMTPVEYIRDIRMHKAALMLKEGKFSVSEVMYTVGFSNSSYFSKCFSKTFGTTPTEYMKG